MTCVLDAVQELDPVKTIVVVGPDAEDVEECAQPYDTVIQKDQLGTGDAVKAALPKLKGFDGNVLIVLGDVPLITPETLKI